MMMQADGKGIAMRPEHRKGGGKADAAHPGIKKMAEIVAVADFTPAVREPEDIAAPPARRKAHPGPAARDKWVSASITESIEDMIGAAYDEADRRDPERVRQRVFLVDGNKQQITAIGAHAGERGLKVPVLIDYIHVSGYIGKAAAALHPGDPAAAGQWADGQLLRVLHGRAKAVAATLASVAARTRANPRTRHLDLTDMDKAVTYLTNNHEYMRYDKALEKGWPIATGMIEGACRFVIEDRFGITGARWSPDGAEVILKLRAVVVNGDLDDYMSYYKNRYRDERHLARYDEASIERPRPRRMTETPGNKVLLKKMHPIRRSSYRCCENFLHDLKGAPPARQRRAGGPDAKQGTRSHRAGMRDRDGHHHQDQGGGAVGHCPTPGRRPCRALSGGSPDGRAAAARSAGPHPQVGGTRRNAAPMAAPAKTGPGPSSVPGILSPRKITVKGAPCGRVATAMGASAHP